MFFIIRVIASLIGSLVYDDPKEGDFSDRKFNPKKFSLFIFTLSLILYSGAMSVRLYRLATEVRQLKQEQSYYRCKYDKDCNSITIQKFEEIDKVIKKPNKVSKD